jgi:hypothetical protein
VIMPVKNHVVLTGGSIILDSTLVPELHAGVLTMTRRVLRPVGRHNSSAWTYYPHDGIAIDTGRDCPDGERGILRCPYGGPGTFLRVRERHALFDQCGDPSDAHNAILAIFPDGGLAVRGRDRLSAALQRKIDRQTLSPTAVWRRGKFLPPWAVRNRVKVEEVRLEQVQQISHADAIAEGMSVALLFPMLERIAQRYRAADAHQIGGAEDESRAYCGRCGRRRARELRQAGESALSVKWIAEVDSPLRCETCDRPLDYLLTAQAARRELEMPAISSPLRPFEAWHLLHTIESVLKDIRRTDAFDLAGKFARVCFQILWDFRHGEVCWRWPANPQVWVVRFSLANDGG